jgi:carboxyl-terminal processing protease
MILRLLLLLVLVSAPINATISSEESLRTLVLHQEKALVDIPSSWTYSKAEQRWIGESGDFYARGLSDDTDLQTLCSSKAAEINGRTGDVVVAEQPACRIEAEDAISFVVKHPSPPSVLWEQIQYIELGGSYIETIIHSLRFDEIPSTSDFMNSLVDMIAAYSYYSAEIDWQTVRLDAVEVANSHGNTQAIEGIIAELRSAGDAHSFYIEEMPDSASPLVTYTPPVSQMVSSEIGYIQIFGIFGADAASDYAEEVQQHIANLDTQHANCWVVDLRQNSGGNMYPMIVGLAPLLGNGVIGSFVDYNNNIEIQLTLQDNHIFDTISATEFVPPLLDNSYELSSVNPPIAVLQSDRTASAAENTLLAFYGRANVRTFGTPTAGFTIGNTSIQLFDGSLLALASVASTDSFNNSFIGPIPPDEYTDSSMDAKAAAIKWLQDKMGCE